MLKEVAYIVNKLTIRSNYRNSKIWFFSYNLLITREISQTWVINREQLRNTNNVYINLMNILNNLHNKYLKSHVLFHCSIVWLESDFREANFEFFFIQTPHTQGTWSIESYEKNKRRSLEYHKIIGYVRIKNQYTLVYFLFHIPRKRSL